MQVVIKDKQSGAVIAQGRDGQVIKAEGNWYFAPEAVNKDALRMTDHDYTCPYKGKCYYADFVDGDRRSERVAWVYGDPMTGWEHIKGHYGFYSGESAKRMGKTIEEVVE